MWLLVWRGLVTECIYLFLNQEAAKVSFQLEEDAFRLTNERSESIRQLLDRQSKEVKEFDAESLQMGFSSVVISSFSDQVIINYCSVLVGIFNFDYKKICSKSGNIILNLITRRATIGIRLVFSLSGLAGF